MHGYKICELARDFSMKKNWRQTSLAKLEKGTMFSILDEMGIVMRKNASTQSIGEKFVSYVTEKCPEGCLLFL